MGIAAPGRATGVRIVRDVVRDAHSNGSGVVHREARRAKEALDRLVLGGEPVETAEAMADRWEVSAREFVESTVHHVRATARRTLAWSGARSEAAAWLIAVGPEVENDLAPESKVAEVIWSVRTASELAILYRGLIVDEGRAATSWTTLGLHHFSEEMYLPIPAALLVGVSALAAERRRAWNDTRRKG
jgi:hypothetical protein